MIVSMSRIRNGLEDAVNRRDEHFVSRKDVNSAFDMTVNN